MRQQESFECIAKYEWLELRGHQYGPKNSQNFKCRASLNGGGARMVENISFALEIK